MRDFEIDIFAAKKKVEKANIELQLAELKFKIYIAARKLYRNTTIATQIAHNAYEFKSDELISKEAIESFKEMWHDKNMLRAKLEKYR